MKRLVIGLVLAGVVVAAAWRDVVRARAEYRRDTVTARTLTEHRRFIDGLCEQVDEQAQQIDELETALKDARGEIAAPVANVLEGLIEQVDELEAVDIERRIALR